MNNSEVVQFFLMDGDVTGRIKCTVANWVGIVYKVPTPLLHTLKDRQDLKQDGIYFLFGETEDSEPEVYIGQARVRKNGEGVLYRVSEHLNKKVYFNDVLMVTTQNNTFGPTEISYLENHLTKLALETRRYKVRNKQEPNKGTITEEKEVELLKVVNYIKLILGVLGYKVFVPILQDTEQHEDKLVQDDILTLEAKTKKSDRTIVAKCKRTNEGFVVLKGSMIEEKISDSLPEKLKELRQKCLNDGDIVDGILQRNYLFNSPSYASMFVLGLSRNGRIDWKNKDGLTLKEIKEKEMLNIRQ